MTMQKFDYPATGDVLYSGTAANGLRIRVLPKKGFSGFYAVFATDYGGTYRRFTLDGTAYDTPAGVAHYLEHKMFDLPDGDNALPYFTAETVAKEQGIIGQEIHMGEDNPGTANYYSLLKLLYRHHPIREKVIGTVESIAEITPEILYACHAAFYTPANMVLCVAGDVDPERVLAIAEEELSSEEKPVPVVSFGEEEDLLPVGSRNVLEMPVSTPQFLIGAKLQPAEKGPALFRQQLTASLAMRLLAGASSPFYNRLYEAGLLNRSFDADADFSTGVGTVILGGESRDPDAVLSALNEEVARIGKVGLDNALFERTKRAGIGSALRGMEDFDDVCVSLALDEFDGFCYLDYPAVMASIEKSECEAFLRDALRPERLALSILAAKKE